MAAIRTVLWGLVILSVAAVAGVVAGRALLDRDDFDNSMSAAFARSGYEEAGGPFRLLDESGALVTEADFKGRPRAVFFGFTHCPDVCPTHLIDAAGWLEALGEDADDLDIFFISVDPERDDPQTLNRYADAFDERIVALTPPDEETLADLAARYRVRYERVPTGESYTMNHTADTLLFDEDGAYAGFIPYMAPNVRAHTELAESERERNVAMLRALVSP